MYNSGIAIDWHQHFSNHFPTKKFQSFPNFSMLLCLNSDRLVDKELLIRLSSFERAVVHIFEFGTIEFSLLYDWNDIRSHNRDTWRLQQQQTNPKFYSHRLIPIIIIMMIKIIVSDKLWNWMLANELKYKIYGVHVTHVSMISMCLFYFVTSYFFFFCGSFSVVFVVTWCARASNNNKPMKKHTFKSKEKIPVEIW